MSDRQRGIREPRHRREPFPDPSGGDDESRGAPSAGPRGLDPIEAETVLRLIEEEIVPRLARADASSARDGGDPVSATGALDDGERDRFLEALMNRSAAAAASRIDDWIARGLPESSLLGDLLPWTAVRLGQLWEDDTEDFSDVTVALCRLHEILRNHARLRTDSGAAPGPDAPQILLVTNGDDQHIFGLLLVADRFRRSGWRVWTEPGAGAPAIAALLAEVGFDVLGVSASREATPESLMSEIAAYRKASRRSDLKVLVGGGLFAGEPRLAARVGADAMAPNAVEAPRIAESLIEEGPFRRREAKPRAPSTGSQRPARGRRSAPSGPSESK